jgi:hypothetical protein
VFIARALEPVVGKHLWASNTAGQVWWRPWEWPEIAIEVVKFGATEVEGLLPSQRHFNNGYSEFEHTQPAYFCIW